MPEDDLLRHIAHRSTDLAGLAGGFGTIEIGPGDDCAVVRTPGGDRVLIGVDQLVAGRHFDPGLLDTADGIDLVARKAVARAVSDLAAMGAKPAWGLATGVLPDGFDSASPGGDALFDAMARWARHWGVPLIGGDVAFGPGPLTLTVTAAGHAVRVVPRSGARAGDGVYVTGAIGGSFASGRHLTFEPRVAQGLAIAPTATSMIDLSDGLGRDAARVGESSGVRVVIDAGRVPRHPDAGEWPEAFSAGEDYELVFTAPGDASVPDRIEGVAVTRIGSVRRAEPGETGGATILDGTGREHDAGKMGWDHGSNTADAGP